MNDSGDAVRRLVRRYGVTPERLVVVHDELDLPTAQLRVKSGGGLAGHNGLRSITAHLHDDSFTRVRIGVSKPASKERGADHVLSRFSKREQADVDVTLEQAADAVELITRDGVDAAMNRYNGSGPAASAGSLTRAGIPAERGAVRDTGDVAGRELELIVRIVVAFGLSFAIGFEREVRGGAAGDRTFSLVGTAAAVISAVAVTKGAGNAIAGIVTGVGFIGGALLFRGETGSLRGITSATAVLAAATIGVVAGAGYLLVALVATGLIVFTLELRFIPMLGYLDARRYVGKYRSDETPPAARRGRRGSTGPDPAGGTTAGP